MQGITIGWSDTDNGLEIYNPIVKKVYTTTVYKIDELNQTKTYFNLTYDGGIYSGLFSTDSRQNVPEFHPIGTVVKVPVDNVSTLGYVIAVSTTTCDTDSTTQLYTIKLQDRTTTTISGIPSCLPMLKQPLGKLLKLHYLRGCAITNRSDTPLAISHTKDNCIRIQTTNDPLSNATVSVLSSNSTR